MGRAEQKAIELRDLLLRLHEYYLQNDIGVFLPSRVAHALGVPTHQLIGVLRREGSGFVKEDSCHWVRVGPPCEAALAVGKHGRGRPSDPKVIAILARRDAGETLAAIARDLGITKQRVSQICLRERPRS